MLLPSFSTLSALAAIPWAFAQQTYPIEGARSGINTRTGEIPSRRNINDLHEEAGPQWDLYIGALTAMQEADENDTTSYFQIAGIHGRPYMAWAGGGPREGQGGFCPHSEALFGSWHRAYLALFEQVLVQHALDIAETYPANVRREYVDAAERLRAPYWDWAASAGVPAVTARETVEINRPTRNSTGRVAVRNPLSSYRYPQSALDQRFGTFPRDSATTRRCFEQGQSYPETPNRELARRDLKSHIYNVLIRARSWAEISSQAGGGNSVEGPHGTIHVHAACGSDFFYLSSSAFDPLFMLHHANVDRLLAFWQALNYETFAMEFEYETGGLFGSPEGTVITPRSPVAPFEGRDGPLNSLDMARIQDWGYTYEPLRFWERSPGQLRVEVTRTINRLYGPSGSQNKARGQSQPATSRGRVQKRGTASQLRPVEREYFAKVEVDRAELDLPVSVDLYVKGNLAGTFALLGMPKKGVSYEEFPLHHGIEGAKLEVATPEHVVAELEEHIEVIITKPGNGTTIPLETVPSLKVQVEDVDVSLPTTDDELPEFGIGQVRAARVKALVFDEIKVKVPCPKTCPFSQKAG